MARQCVLVRGGPYSMPGVNGKNMDFIKRFISKHVITFTHDQK